MHSQRKPEESLSKGYETSDWRLTPIVAILGAVVVTTILTLILVFFILRGFDSWSQPSALTVSPLRDPRVQMPTGVRLQQDPVAERIAFEDAASEYLNSYGLVYDAPEMERAHIPIDRAMELIAEGEAPYRQPVQSAIAGGDQAAAAAAPPDAGENTRQ